MVTVIATKKGASLPQNTWKEGTEVKCHENLAKHFIKHGLCIEPENFVKSESNEVEKVKTTKTKK